MRPKTKQKLYKFFRTLAWLALFVLMIFGFVLWARSCQPEPPPPPSPTATSQPFTPPPPTEKPTDKPTAAPPTITNTPQPPPVTPTQKPTAAPPVTTVEPTEIEGSTQACCCGYIYNDQTKRLEWSCNCVDTACGGARFR